MAPSAESAPPGPTLSLAPSYLEAAQPRPEGLAILLSDLHAHGRARAREGEVLSQPNFTGGQMPCGQLA